MAVTTLADLHLALDSNPEAIIGTEESSWLEFKGEPYDLGRMDQKVEMAKDVTALANATGGVIILGIQTRKDVNSRMDIADKIRRIPMARVDVDQLRKVIQEFTYPPVRDLTCRWWSVQDDKALFTIEVPPAPDGDKPVLTAKALYDESVRRGLLVGIFERVGDQVAAFSIQEIHADIQLGRILRRAGVTTPATLTPGEQGPSDEERARRLQDDLQASNLAGQPRYLLQAWPLAPCEVRDIHSREPDGFRYVMGHPSQLRPHGFGMRTYAAPDLLPNGGLRITVEREALSVQRDGLFTWMASAGPDYLSWASEKWGRPGAINPVALVESTLEFVRFFQQEVLHRCDPQPGRWAILGGLYDLKATDPPVVLARGSNLRTAFQFREFAEPPTNDILVEIKRFSSVSAGKAAYLVLRDIYSQFGVADTEIPYSDGEEISEAQIAGIDLT